MVNTSTTAVITAGANTGGAFFDVKFQDCGVKFANAAQSISVRQARFVMEGGSLLSGGTSPTSFVVFAGDGAMALLDGVNLVNAAAAVNIFSPSTMPVTGVIRNSKLPASWSGALGVPTGPAQRFEMYNCDSTDTNYRLWISDFTGSVKSETTIVRTGGASDGTTALSWKMDTTANALYPMLDMRSPEIVAWNTTLSSITATVEIVHDTNVAAGQGAGTGSRFQDDEVWLEVMSLSTSGFPLGTWTRDSKADVLAAAADQTDSSGTLRLPLRRSSGHACRRSREALNIASAAIRVRLWHWCELVQECLRSGPSRSDGRDHQAITRSPMEPAHQAASDQSNDVRSAFPACQKATQNQTK